MNHCRPPQNWSLECGAVQIAARQKSSQTTDGQHLIRFYKVLYRTLVIQEFRRQTTDLLLNRDRLLDQLATRQQALAGPRLAAEPVPQAKHLLDGGKHVAGEM